MRSEFWISLCLAATGLSASSQTVPTINACVNNLSGATRVVASSANCINGVETFKQWNVTGPEGPQGPAGAQGAQGIIGPQGQRGANGVPGPMGNTGPQGPQGDTGAQGAQGPPGVIGAKGNPGPPGLPGAVGDTGAQGPKGDTGAQGPSGPAGPSGPTGPAGTPGGQILIGNESLPTTIPVPASYGFPLVGASAPTTLPASMLPRPANFCANAQNYTFNVVNAPGTTTMTFYLALGQSELKNFPISTQLLCSVTANSGNTVSCTANVNGRQFQDFNSLGLFVTTDSGFQGANILSTLSCQ